MALFRCSSCGLEHEVPDKFIGKSGRCPRCSAKVAVVEAIAAIEVPEGERAGEAGGFGIAPPPPAADDAGSAPWRDLDAGRDSDSGHPRDFSTDSLQVHYLPIQAQPSDGSWERRTLFQGNPARNLFAGALTGVVSGFIILALAFFVFGSRLPAGDLPALAGMALMGGAVLCLASSLGSRLPFLVAGVETTSAVIVALMVRDLVARLSLAAPGEPLLPTVFAAIAGSALVAGIILMLAGAGRLGKWVRFLPHQVVAGVLAALGWFLLRGALAFLTGTESFFAEPALYFHSEAVMKVIPGLAFGLLLFLALRTVRKFWMLPLLLALAVGGAHILFAYLGVSPQEALSRGWLFAPMAPQPVWELAGPGFFTGVLMAPLAGCIPYAAVLAGMLVAVSMLKIAEIETVYGKKLELDREFVNLGRANLLAGLLGGMPGSISRGRSLASMGAGATGPLAGLAAGAVLAALVFYWGELIAWLPRFVVGGLLLFFGLKLLSRWLVDTWTMFTRKDDYGVLLLVFLATVGLGLLMGVGVGLALGLIIFISRHGRADVVKHAFSGASFRSSVDRSPFQLALLGERGGEIHILRLTGFIFLGTVSLIIDRIIERIEDESAPRLKFLVLDFRLVSGLDSMVSLGLKQLKRFAADNGFSLILTSIPIEVERQLEEGGFILNEPDGLVRAFTDQDFAMEWCENVILTTEGVLEVAERSLPELLSQFIPEPALIKRLMGHLARIKVARGRSVFRQGDVSESMYFIESGMVAVILELEGNRSLRLKKMGPGTVFGEMGLYTDAPRSASIVAAEDCVLHRLSADTLDELQNKDPELVSMVHRLVVMLLSMRLSEANAKLSDLSK